MDEDVSPPTKLAKIVQVELGALPKHQRAKRCAPISCHLGGEALRLPEEAATLRLQGGEVVVTDGPYAETKEQLGGILLLEARDQAHAITLMSKHPGLQFGPFEIRPANEAIQELYAARSDS